MSAYVKHGDQVVLIFSKAEANALLDVVVAGDDSLSEIPANGATIDARRRAVRAVETACEKSSRTGAAIQ